MRRASVVLIFGALLALGSARPLTAGEPGKKGGREGSVKAINHIVKSFYHNLSEGRPDRNLKFFLSPDVPFVGIPGGEGVEKIYQKKVSEVWMKNPKGETVRHTVDSVHVEFLDDALAVARVRAHTRFIKGRAIITFTSEGGHWRIVSFVSESRLP
jgi:hypothetical protein